MKWLDGITKLLFHTDEWILEKVTEFAKNKKFQRKMIDLFKKEALENDDIREKAFQFLRSELSKDDVSIAIRHVALAIHNAQPKSMEQIILVPKPEGFESNAKLNFDEMERITKDRERQMMAIYPLMTLESSTGKITVSNENEESRQGKPMLINPTDEARRLARERDIAWSVPPSKSKQGKLFILIIDDGSNPDRNTFYTGLCKPHFPFKAHYSASIDKPLSLIVEEELDGRSPDYILIGENIGSWFQDSMLYIAMRKIKLICETGDPKFFGHRNIGIFVCKNFHHLTDIDIPLLISHTGDSRAEMLRRARKFNVLKESRHFVLPSDPIHAINCFVRRFIEIFLAPPVKPAPKKKCPRILVLCSTFCTRALKSYLSLKRLGFDPTVAFSLKSELTEYIDHPVFYVLEKASIANIIDRTNPDIIHVHHNNTLSLWVREAGYKGILITDMHDSPRKDQKEAIEISDYLVTVHDRYADWVKKEFPTDKKIYGIESVYKDDCKFLPKRDDKTRFCLIGSLYRDHIAREQCGILKAVANRLNIHIHIYANNFKEIIDEFTDEFLHREHEIPFREVTKTLSQYDAGVVHGYTLDGASSELSFPNKIYDYLCAGIPLIVDKTRALAGKQAEDTGTGICIDIAKMNRSDIERLRAIEHVTPEKLGYNDISTLPCYAGGNTEPKLFEVNEKLPTIGFLDRFIRIRDFKEIKALKGKANIIFMKTTSNKQNDLSWIKTIEGVKEGDVADICKREGIQALHTHGTNTDMFGKWGIDARKATKIPVIHECHDAITCYEGCSTENARLEIEVLKGADALIVVSPDMLKYYDDQYNVGKKCAIIYAYPNKDMLPSFSRVIPKSFTNCVYQGGILDFREGSPGNHRYYKKIFSRLTEQGINIDVYPSSGINRQAAAWELAENNKIRGMQHIPDVRQLYETLSHYHFGFVGYHRTESIKLLDMALPNKLFEYICCGIPVLVMDYSSIADFVQHHGFGIVVGDDMRLPEDFNEQMYHAKKLVMSGRSKFTMESQAETLLELYRGLIRGF